MKRIVLYGAPLAGKTTLLTAVASVRRASVETFYAGSLNDDLPRCRGARALFPHSSSMIEVTTLVGPPQNDGIWNTLLQDAAAIVLVLDGQREREEANRACIANLVAKVRDATMPGCIVVTKQDLPSATFDPAQWERTRFVNWPTAASRVDNVASATAAIDDLVRNV